MTRAVLEGSAFALRDILEAMQDAGLEVRRLTIVGRRREGAAVAADQGRRDRAARARAGERGDHRDRGRDPCRGWLGSARDGRDAVDAFVATGPRNTSRTRSGLTAYDEAYRRYRDVYFALKPGSRAG